MTEPPDLPTPPIMLTTSEVATRLRVSSMTVRRWIEDGRLPAFTEGRVHRVRLDDLDEFVALSTRSSTPKVAP